MSTSKQEADLLKQTKDDLDAVRVKATAFQKKLEELKAKNKKANRTFQKDRDLIDELYTRALEDAKKIMTALLDAKTFESEDGVRALEKLLVRATEDFVAHEKHHEKQMQYLSKRKESGKDDSTLSEWKSFKFDFERAKITIKRGFLDIIESIQKLLIKKAQLQELHKKSDRIKQVYTQQSTGFENVGRQGLGKLAGLVSKNKAEEIKPLKIVFEEVANNLLNQVTKNEAKLKIATMTLGAMEALQHKASKEQRKPKKPEPAASSGNKRKAEKK